ncbi:MAG: MFS transporter [Parachlamydiaceae bacterium]|nr:MFS transporter [Parachlamydiaceae bacterium]
MMRQQITALVRKFSSFTYLNITQFLGAMNDNIYKLLTIYFFIQMEGIENSHIVLATTGAIYVMPFLLLSSSAGILADRYSKRNILILTKMLELVIISSGLFAFAYSSKIGSYCILFFLAVHSVLFSPSKYGILPELLPPERISKANGIMTSFTYLAIILGTFLASFLLDITGRNFIIASMFCVVLSIIGLTASLCIQYTPPSGSRKKLDIHFISDIYQTLKWAKKEPSLLAAILGSAFFLFLGAYVQLNMIPFAVQSLGLTDVQGGYLFLLTAIGIGTGSIIAGKMSGNRVELALTPLAGVGITISFFALDMLAQNIFAVVPLVMIIGVFGGIYLIPLDSYVQVSSPKQNIGQAVAATTFLSFLGVLFASILLYVLSELFGLQAHQGFAIIGSLTLAITVVYTFLFFDYLTRFLGMILSRIHFRTTSTGTENIPEAPALYVCTHTAWNDTLLMLGAQRRRMRFFIEHEQEHSKWLKRLYRLLRVVLIPEIESLENNPACLTAIKNTLEKGISVCIFISDPNVSKEFDKLKHAHLVREILQDKRCPLVAVHIEKGEKDKKPRFFRRLLNKCRVPASISFEAVSWEDTSTGSGVDSNRSQIYRLRAESKAIPPHEQEAY